MSAGGKGHTQRPTDDKNYSDGYERIWGKKDPEPKDDQAGKDAEGAECN